MEEVRDRPAVVVIRPMSRADEPRLRALYRRLDLDDRCARFLGASVPVHLTPAGGGVAVVAEVRGDGDGDESDGEIVGEAQYARLPNGAGELGLAVDRPWRDRVAALLLDALVDRAAGDGVANLEADVAHHDVTLRGLLHARGAATVGGDGWRVTRLRVGTTGPTPTWSPGDRPRLLVEGSGGRWPFVEELRGSGFDVIVCPGPRVHSCPALRGASCALAADADAVVIAGSPDAWPALFAAHDTLHPGVPVAVEPQRRPPASSCRAR